MKKPRLAREHVVAIQYALSLQIVRHEKYAEKQNDSTMAGWHRQQADNITAALEAFKETHGDLRSAGPRGEDGQGAMRRRTMHKRRPDGGYW